MAVDAYEYVGEPGIGGSLLGVGDGARESQHSEGAILFVYFRVRCGRSQRSRKFDCRKECAVEVTDVWKEGKIVHLCLVGVDNVNR